MKKFSEMIDPLSLKQAIKMKRREVMQININIPDTDLDGMTIKDLIIADIHLGLICEKLTNYDYDMHDIVEKRELVQDELNKKLKADTRRKLQKLIARRESLLPDDVILKNIDNEIEKLKNKI